MDSRKYGVVYTPDRLADFAAELLHLEMHDIKCGSVLDPACGECALLKAAKRKLGEDFRYLGIDVDVDAYMVSKDEFSIVLNDSVLPKNVKHSTADYWKRKLGKVSVIIANPPWSTEKIYDKDKLTNGGFSLISGQYDSFVLFVELAYKVLEDGGYFSFIIPDSLFDSQNEKLRRFLATKTEIRVIARLGEKIFDEVNRATTVIVCKKALPNTDSITHCFRLDTDSRKHFLSSEKPLIDFYNDAYHDVRQSRFLQNEACNFDIDIRSDEEKLISKIRSQTIDWDREFIFGRGVEISKSGEIVYCKKCGFAQGYKKSQLIAKKKVCTHCGEVIIVDTNTIKNVVSKEYSDNKTRIYVGENIRRYTISGENYIEPNIPGINYKDLTLYHPPKLLVRKTGLGIYASIDYSGSMTSQTVYILKQKQDAMNVPLEYYLAMINSRVVYYYYLKVYGENEWKSHPYLTKQIIFSLPIIEFTGSADDLRIVALATELAESYEHEKDVQLEKLIMKKYSLSPVEERMIYDEMNKLPDLSAINDMKVEAAMNV